MNNGKSVTFVLGCGACNHQSNVTIPYEHIDQAYHGIEVNWTCNNCGRTNLLTPQVLGRLIGHLPEEQIQDLMHHFRVPQTSSTQHSKHSEFKLEKIHKNLIFIGLVGAVSLIIGLWAGFKGDQLFYAFLVGIGGGAILLFGGGDWLRRQEAERRRIIRQHDIAEEYYEPVRESRAERFERDTQHVKEMFGVNPMSTGKAKKVIGGFVNRPYTRSPGQMAWRTRGRPTNEERHLFSSGYAHRTSGLNKEKVKRLMR